MHRREEGTRARDGWPVYRCAEERARTCRLAARAATARARGSASSMAAATSSTFQGWQARASRQRLPRARPTSLTEGPSTRPPPSGCPSSRRAAPSTGKRGRLSTDSLARDPPPSQKAPPLVLRPAAALLRRPSSPSPHFFFFCPFISFRHRSFSSAASCAGRTQARWSGAQRPRMARL